MVWPFCITNIEMPRLLSEYLAARAQSPARISANANVDVRSVAKIDHKAVLTIRVVAAAVLSGHSQNSAARDGGGYTSGFSAVASGAPAAPATVAGGRVLTGR